ncbi:LysR family transcriptional regulator [Pseudomonas sp. PIC25]|uniref:LysR substrate-binding domain-containing protein n=1 Tax=Pseudomonas sp. PIC25 TaxID=1958773 RepID=UPI000BABE025|nr:LysR substrate-binding domain-containing protein [Pseudomonas sp. PIC25]PAU63915.1 LysR family transcriptional regulator [Pseudomonas sp. PIC25]
MTTRSSSPLPEDLRVFLAVIRKSSFAAAAQELGVSPAFISKRIRILEETLQARLLHRSTRSIALTEAGEKAQRWATRFLDEMDDFVSELTTVRQIPRGLLHICSSFGFGRNYVAPAVAQLSSAYPELEVRLDVFDRVVDIVAEGFDLEIRVGDDLPGHHIGRKLASNQRVLCATPVYLQKRGLPTTINELALHDCLVIKERSNPFGVWRLNTVEREEIVRVGSRLSSNNGEIVLQWALSDLGIILRSLWDVQPLLEQGRLVRVLPEYTQSANVWAVYPTRLADSAKLRVCVEFLQRYFAMTLLGD